MCCDRPIKGKQLRCLANFLTGRGYVPLPIINAVETRPQTRSARKGRKVNRRSNRKEEEEIIIVSSDAESQILIPALQEYVPELAQLKVTRQDLIEAKKSEERECMMRYNRALRNASSICCLETFRSVFAVTLPLVRSNSRDAQLAVPIDPRYARLETNLGISQDKEG
ncbi:hypothetical protein TNCV_5000851 [Trichonephila clavipes]|nr:hypothetical protein TNCV_5000851 [Trichonephila clavipes]